MAKGRGFELIPQPVPPRRMSSSSFYKQIISEFIKSGNSSVMVGGTDRKPATLVQGLRKALGAAGITDVTVIQRSGEVFISKE